MSERDEVVRAVEGLADVLGEMRPKNANAQTITIQAGGIGIWIATTCCAVMLGMAIMGAAIILDQQRQLADLRDYLAAIYVQAPNLKPVEKDKP